MISKTKGIVLRSVKYGETSLIVTIFTELFGLQSYLVNGVRQSSKKGGAKATFFQPASILEVVAYHNDFNKLQRLREFKWDFLYQHVLSDVRKNAVALFMVELLGKCLKQPESNPDLFYFVEDALRHLDEATDSVTGNFPLFFALHLAVFFGFRISDEYSDEKHYLDLQEGRFTGDQPSHQFYLLDREAAAVSDILKIMQPQELEQIFLNQEMRRRITHAIEQYYAFHIPEFGTLRTLPVLREIMS
ncbi:DNA repair protein RecO [Flavisolibacter nicotianae]|uniref:DNA repair protein RecO n=1 Tax=Flavisolibacter nicotianae TaxID=2364882 RepID=UPI000EB06AFF|nr:DNA repair protein RecO [Flavisolibacter nicotianae]